METKHKKVGPKSWWGSRSKLERYLIVSLTVGLLIIVILMGILISRGGILELCVTPSCILAIGQFLKNTELSADPCENFYEFACGNSDHLQRNLSSWALAFQKLNRNIELLLEDEIDPDDPQPIQLIKRIYQSCRNESEIEERGLRYMSEILNKLGGWPVLSRTWNATEWFEIFSSARRLGLKIEPFFNVELVENDEEYVLKITPPKSWSVGDNWNDGYVEYMSEVAVLLGGDKREAYQELRDAYSFENKLAQIVEENKSDLPEIEVDIAQLGMYVHDIPWLKLINGALLLNEVDISEKIIFAAQEYSHNLVDLLNSTRKNIVANYVLWKVIDNNMNYLPKTLLELKERHLREYQSLSRDSICKNELKHLLPFATKVAYIRKHLPTNTREKAQEIIESIKHQLIKIIENLEYSDEEEKTNAKEIIDSLVISIGCPEELYDDTYFENHFQFNINYTEDNYWDILSKITRQKLDFYFDLLHKSTSTPLEHVGVNSLKNHKLVLVLDLFNFNEMYYAPDRPQYMNYGILGAIVAYQITSLLNNELLENKTRELSDCFKNTTAFDVNRDDLLDELALEHFTINLAYSAYESWLKVPNIELTLPNLESYSFHQLFWLSVANYYCQDVDLKLANHANVAFMNSRRFVDDFSCSIDSNMNIQEKCGDY